MNILITGGASGLGYSIVEKLAINPEFNILFTYCHSQKSAQELCSRFNNIKAFKCDFSNPDEINLLTEEMVKSDIDCIVNNAISGKIEKSHFQKLDTSPFISGFNSNILPFIILNQAAIKIFRKKKFGKVITVLSSVLVNKPPIGWSEYTATKAYIHSLCKSMSVENSVFNITSNCVSPSFMNTKINEDTDERILEQIILNHPLKKILSIEEVAESILFLVNCSQQINGVNMIINAGENIS